MPRSSPVNWRPQANRRDLLVDRERAAAMLLRASHNARIRCIAFWLAQGIQGGRIVDAARYGVLRDLAIHQCGLMANPISTLFWSPSRPRTTLQRDIPGETLDALFGRVALTAAADDVDDRVQLELDIEDISDATLSAARLPAPVAARATLMPYPALGYGDPLETVSSRPPEEQPPRVFWASTAPSDIAVTWVDTSYLSTSDHERR